ncbi:hypothetical protein H1O16_gp108 [Burkholderia phage BcepSaruman]|uniref:Uncharacterized protein n=1 Tax=Burkholderia phage BcepSaruman TaxID=2530032 RepID=A0A4D5ZCJ9_9CAUD|nr:hypothetical protein H1O16_gp108 [Burkholderia phage BcepSaruman]QBX06521.1 hypothetical protein BcepSaruman_108 [Burkholderia phage BcepSaruman]
MSGGKKAQARKFAGVNQENIKFTKAPREPEALSQKGYGTVFSTRLDNSPEDLYMLVDGNGYIDGEGTADLFCVRIVNGVVIGLPYSTLVYDRALDFNIRD